MDVSRRSWRTISRRQRAIQDRVRSTTHRCRPSRSLLSIPRRAIRGTMPACGRRGGSAVVVGLVGVQLLRAPSRPAARLADRRDGVERLLQHGAVVDVGGREQDRRAGCPPVDDEVALGARLAAVGRVRPGRGPARLGRHAGAVQRAPAPVDLAGPAEPSSSVWWNACQTPACCQSRSRRQQVIPQPQPISCGSISQGMPLLSTKRMPVSAARSSTGGRPPFGRGGRGGSRGLKRDQRASETRGAAMRP